MKGDGFWIWLVALAVVLMGYTISNVIEKQTFELHKLYELQLCEYAGDRVESRADIPEMCQRYEP